MRRELPFFDFVLCFAQLLYAMHWRNEHVTTAVDSFDVSRGFSVVTEGRADFFDTAVYALVEIDGRFSVPKFFANLAPRHKLARMRSKQRKESESLR